MSNAGSGVDKPLRAVGAVRAVRAEGVWAHTRRWGRCGGLGTHWKPLNTSERLTQPAPRAEGGEQWVQCGVDKALRAVHRWGR